MLSLADPRQAAEIKSPNECTALKLYQAAYLLLRHVGRETERKKLDVLTAHQGEDLVRTCALSSIEKLLFQ